MKTLTLVVFRLIKPVPKQNSFSLIGQNQKSFPKQDNLDMGNYQNEANSENMSKNRGKKDN